MCLFLDEACSLAEKLLNRHKFKSPLMPDKDNNFGGSLVWILENDDIMCNPRIQDVT